MKRIGYLVLGIIFGVILMLLFNGVDTHDGSGIVEPEVVIDETTDQDTEITEEAEEGEEDSEVEGLSVKVFFANTTNDPAFLDCTKVHSVDREIEETSKIGEAAILELLEGPTPDEESQGYFTSLNDGTKLNSLSIENGTAYVDFDYMLDYQVGGSCKTATIAAQISETLKQFSSVDNVVISRDGETESILQP